MHPRISHVVRLMLLLLISCLLAGCPLDTEYPLTTRADIKIDPKLLGSWVFSPDNTEIDIIVLKIFSFNDTEYYIEGIYKENDVSRCRAYITIIDNVSFLNIHSIEDQKKIFELYKLVFTSDNTVSLLIIDDQLFKKDPSSSEELYDVVRKNLANPKLYGGEVNLRRTGKFNKEGQVILNPLPDVYSRYPKLIGADNALITGGVKKLHNLETTIWFEWGTDPNLGTYSTTTPQHIQEVFVSCEITDLIRGLAPNTFYYYRFAASNINGTSKSKIHAFKTTE